MFVPEDTLRGICHKNAGASKCKNRDLPSDPAVKHPPFTAEDTGLIRSGN